LTSFRKLSLTILFAFTCFFAAPVLTAQSANDLFARAQTEAQSENKDILLVFSASWCGPCKLYERFLQDSRMKPITDRAFVVVRIDVGERPGAPGHADTPGGTQLRTALGAVGEPGFPFLVITDPYGKPIVNSYRGGNQDANVGYPAAPEEIDWYIEMLRRVPALLPADLTATRDWLKQHVPH
jgi:thioredoxin-related protein